MVSSSCLKKTHCPIGCHARRADRLRIAGRGIHLGGAGIQQRLSMGTAKAVVGTRNERGLTFDFHDFTPIADGPKARRGIVPSVYSLRSQCIIMIAVVIKKVNLSSGRFRAPAS